ncbi:MAG: protein kinase [Myxococcales bacterium]|nr:protein kinase [Myxococcales bacterium]
MLTGQLGPYTLVKKIAVGGMAEIYHAIVPDTEPLRQVAIKVIHPNNSEDPDFVRMLLDEARLAVRLKHPNIVTTYDLGKEKEQYYLVMELVEGVDLFRLEQRSTEHRLSIPVPLAAYIVREVARGLHFAHELTDATGKPLQVVHRDVSPQNVLLSYSGEVKITDFGIAKAEGRSEQTQIGIIKGKYYYMSPEQSAGQPLDRRTDIFACGILLYEMLAGEMLYFDQSVEKLLDKVRKAEVPPLARRRPDVPAELERIMLRALKRRPEDRYRSGEELAQALDGFLRRQAPTFSAQELGKFVEKVQTTQPKKRTADEPTAALDLSHAARLSMEARDDDEQADRSPSPTMGIDSSQFEQLRALGVKDDNSLLFQSGNLKALLEGKASRKSPSESDDESARPGTAKGLRPSDSSDVTTHRRIAGRIYEAAPPKAVFPAITADGEMFGLLTEQADLLPRPTEVGQVGAGRRRSSSSDLLATHSQSVAVGDSVTAIAPVGILPPGVERSKRTRRPSSKSSGEPSAEAARPKLSEPKMELLQSDVSYEQPSSLPDSRSVQMTQSDQFPSQKARLSSTHKQISPSKPVPGRSSGENRAVNIVAEPSGQIDIISTEMTHDALDAPADLRGSMPPLEPSVEPSSEVSDSRGRWLFVLAGVSAAVISAALTWFLIIGPQRGQRSVPSLEDLAQSQDLGSPPDLQPVSDGTATKETDKSIESKPKTLPVEGKQKASAGQVLIRSEPPGATVLIDKQPVGVTPIILADRTVGEDFKIELMLDGYKKGRKRIKWKNKDRLDIKVKLQSESDEAASTLDGADEAK